MINNDHLVKTGESHVPTEDEYDNIGYTVTSVWTKTWNQTRNIVKLCFFFGGGGRFWFHMTSPDTVQNFPATILWFNIRNSYSLRSTFNIFHIINTYNSLTKLNKPSLKLLPWLNQKKHSAVKVMEGEVCKFCTPKSQKKRYFDDSGILSIWLVQTYQFEFRGTVVILLL